MLSPRSTSRNNIQKEDDDKNNVDNDDSELLKERKPQ